MAVDPAERDARDARDALDEVLEELEELEEASAEPRQGRMGESSEADAAEQRREVLRLRDEPLAERGPAEVDPGDAQEQSRVVDPGEDEYR